jgi:hypothetical protein
MRGEVSVYPESERNWQVVPDTRCPRRNNTPELLGAAGAASKLPAPGPRLDCQVRRGQAVADRSSGYDPPSEIFLRAVVAAW